MSIKKVVEHIPRKKLQEVETLKKLIETKPTVLVVSIKNIPASQFQEIGKKLRGKAIIKVPKKSLVFRAIDSVKDDELKKIEGKIEDSFAFLFSDLDSFELAKELLENRSPSKAKPGQIAPMDIEVEAGPTELVPGPAISELGALGIQIQIEKGKIHIKESKVIVKEGDKIKQAAADLMAKLDIKPFSVGFTPICAYDTKTNTLFTEIHIDTEEAVSDLKNSFSKALAFAVSIEYPCKETIQFLISKAAMHEKTLDNLKEKEPEKVEEKKDASEEKVEETNEKNTQTPEKNQEEEK